MDSLPHEIKLLVLESAAANSFDDFLSLRATNNTFYNLYSSQANSLLDKTLTTAVGGSRIYRALALELGQREDLRPRTVKAKDLQAAIELLVDAQCAQFERKELLKAIRRFQLVQRNAYPVAARAPFHATMDAVLIELYESLASGPPVHADRKKGRRERHRLRDNRHAVREIMRAQLADCPAPGPGVTSRTVYCVETVLRSMIGPRFSHGWWGYDRERFHLGVPSEGAEKLYRFNTEHLSTIDKGVRAYLDWRDLYSMIAAVAAVEDAFTGSDMQGWSFLGTDDEGVLGAVPVDVRDKYLAAVEAMRETFRRNLEDFTRKEIITRVSS